MSTDEMPPNIAREFTTSEAAGGSPSTFVSEYEFCEMLSNFFRPYVKEVCPANQINCIERSWEQFEPHFGREELVRIYLEFMYSLFKKFRTTNPGLSVYDLLYISRDDKLLVFRNFPTSLRSHLCTFSEYMEADTISFQLIIRLSRDFETLQRILRYGVRFETTGICVFDCVRVLARKLFECGFLPDFNYKRLHLRISSNYPNSDDLRRLIFICLATYVALEKPRKLHFVSNIKTLDLMFQTIPEPLITVQEISRLLHLIVKSEDKESVIQVFCNKFVKEFPNSIYPLKPRSLKHLCCCRVRECLRQSRNLPHGIWGLNLPVVLKNYILLYQKADHFYAKYLAALFTEKRISIKEHISNREKTLWERTQQYIKSWSSWD